MNDHKFDPVQFKAAQRKSWNSVADGWRRWWQVLENGAQKVSDRLIDLAGVKEGHKVLDIATGTGEPAVSAARRVGETGSVLAIDQAAEMLEVARERANLLGLKNVEFKEMDCEKIDRPQELFDAALCRWGLMFLPDLAGTLSKLHTMLAPQGRLATSVWSVPQKVPMISLAMSEAMKFLEAPPPPKGTPNPFGLADTDVLKKAFTEAGFTDVHAEPITVTFEFPSAEAYMRFTQEINAPIVAIVEKHPAEKQVEVWELIEKSAKKFAVEGGAVRMSNEAICVVAKK